MTEHPVTLLRSGRALLVPDNGNLREAFLREGVPLYRGLARFTNCQGRARCGTCVVRVAAGGEHLSAPTPFEVGLRPGSPPEERLACQANVRGPVTLDV